MNSSIEGHCILHRGKLCARIKGSQIHKICISSNYTLAAQYSELLSKLDEHFNLKVKKKMFSFKITALLLVGVLISICLIEQTNAECYKAVRFSKDISNVVFLTIS